MSAPRIGRRGDALGGLPAALPDGERVLWQGRPDWRGLARRALHVRKAALWLALMLGWFVVAQWGSGEAGRTAAGFLVLSAFGAAALGMLVLVAVLQARSAVYTLTDKRLVLRFGIAMTLSLNLPFAIIDGAALKLFRDGSGDIPLRLRAGKQRLGWVVLWPHARPWRLSQPQPMLRSVPDAARVAAMLSEALAASVAEGSAAVSVPVADAPAPVSVARPVRVPEPAGALA